MHVNHLDFRHNKINLMFYISQPVMVIFKSCVGYARISSPRIYHHSSSHMHCLEKKWSKPPPSTIRSPSFFQKTRMSWLKKSSWVNHLVMISLSASCLTKKWDLIHAAQSNRISFFYLQPRTILRCAVLSSHWRAHRNPTSFRHQQQNSSRRCSHQISVIRCLKKSISN